MKRSSKIIIASLMALGVSGAVLAYGAHHHCKHASAEDRAATVNHHLSRKLDLNSEQEVHLQALTLRAAEIIEEVRNERDTRQQMIDELLSDETFDQNMLLQKISEKTDLVNRNAPEMVALIGQFVDSLDSEQRAELNSMLSERRGLRGWRHRYGNPQEARRWQDDPQS